MSAGTGYTVETNPKNEDTGRGDGQRMLINTAPFRSMCFHHSEISCPLVRDGRSDGLHCTW
jgi:hypothetical protein